MKKKQKTFADRAKAIKAKYTRADWDKIERRDMMKELSELRDEQEEVRVSKEIDNQNSESKEFWAGGEYDNIGVGNIGGMNQHLVDINSLNLPNNLVDASKNTLATIGSQFENPGTNILPFAISAGASAIGDIMSLRNINKNMPTSVNLPRMIASKINLQPNREALGRSYNTAQNIMSRNARDVSSPANAYANQVAGITALTDSYGTQMGTSYMNEENANAQLAQQASQVNAEIGSREALTNLQLKQGKIGIQNQYIDSLSQTIPLALKDYRQQASQTDTINMMGKEFGMYSRYNPNMTFAEKLRMGILGPQYEIKNREYANKNLHK